MTISELYEAMDEAWADFKLAQKMGDAEGQRIACVRSHRIEAQLTEELAKQGHRGAISMLRYRQKVGL